MPSADYKVEIVDSSGEADMSVTVIGDQVVDLTGATDGQVLTVQNDGTVAPENPAPDSTAVPKALYDANTVLKADTDNTPVALPMGASTILARLAAGGIVAATPAEIRTLLSLADADVSALAARVGQVCAYLSGGELVPSYVAVTTGTLTQSALYAGIPFRVPVACSISAMNIDVTVVGVGSTIRLGIATANANGMPGTIVLDAVAAGATAIDSALGIGRKSCVLAANFALTPGVTYYPLAVAQGGQPQVRIARAHGKGVITAAPADFSDPLLTTGARTATTVTGALPGSFVFSANAAVPIITATYV